MHIDKKKLSDKFYFEYKILSFSLKFFETF